MEESNMNALIKSLTVKAKVSLEDDDINLIHPRYAQYKIRNKTSNQEERRKQWLQNQKEKRSETINVRRGIQGDHKIFMEEMELEYTKKVCYKKIVRDDNRPYKDWIMMSEWLVDVPNNFFEDWICTICPEGRRVLVIAEKGSTSAYSRRGDFLMKFPSALPGGCGEAGRGHTIVDCIWHHPTKTFFLLDVLIWGVPLTNCESELRFYWLTNKFSELPNLTKVSVKNRHKFLLLQHNPVSQLQHMLAVHPPFENNFPKADGILFFHKDCLYTGGKSPLVTWLKPFMVQHILNIPIAAEYIAEKPLNYPEITAKPEKQESETTLCSEIKDIMDFYKESTTKADTSMDVETTTFSDITLQTDDTSQNQSLNSVATEVNEVTESNVPESNQNL